MTIKIFDLGTKEAKKWFQDKDQPKQGIWIVPIVTNWFPRYIRIGLKSKEESAEQALIVAMKDEIDKSYKAVRRSFGLKEEESPKIKKK